MAGPTASAGDAGAMTLSVRISHPFPAFRLDVDLEAPEGVTAIFGPSGAGKTTIINAVAGLFLPHSGCITSRGATFFDSDRRINLPTQKRQVGYVFQDHRLFPHLDVKANLNFGRRARKIGENRADFDRIVSMLGLEQLLGRSPFALSGGEKQRVAIGRALLSAPEVLLLDEPLASLDQMRRQEILPYLERLRDEARLPILYVSHSVSEVARLSNQVLVIDQGQQSVLGPVGDVFAHPHAAGRMGAEDLGAVLFAKVHAHHSDGVTELASAGGRLFLPKTNADIGAFQRVRIRAQDVMLSRQKPEQISALNVLSGTIVDISKDPDQSGKGVLVRVRCGDDLLLSRITLRSLNALDLRVGEPIYAVLKTVSVARGDVGQG
ncbi:molybdenum ABC transporter ATP-binding protein [Cognatishimia activa]|nr:molybdenum ABC transporter ATP-binding protein [Cognatishimia activa]